MVADITPPVIADKQDHIVTGVAPMTVTYVAPVVTDNSDVSIIAICTPPSGSLFTSANTSVTCTAQDSSNLDATPVTFNVILTPAPDTAAPAFTSDATLVFDENVQNRHQITTNDTSASFTIDSHNVLGSSLPTVSANGLLEWTPSESQGGSGTIYTIKVRATDPNGNSDTQDIQITIPETNSDPVFGEIPTQRGSPGEQIAISLFAVDTDVPTNALTYGTIGTFGAVSANGSRTAEFTWTPAESDIGIRQITFTVRDGVGGSDSKTVSFDISQRSASSDGDSTNATLTQPVTPAPPLLPQASVSNRAVTYISPELINSFGRTMYLSEDRIVGLAASTFSRGFDISTGNAVFDAIMPNIHNWLGQSVTPHFGDSPLVFRYLTLLFNAGYDATAPFDDDSVGVYSRITHLDASEHENTKSINTAVLHSAYHLAVAFDPTREDQWRTMLVVNGLNPDDKSGYYLDCGAQHTLSSPVEIGNLAAKCVLEGRMHDGFNHFGDETPGYPFKDTTGYMPVNSANNLVDPSRWQPLVTMTGPGVYTGQEFITPQWADTEPYTGIDPRAIRADAPADSNHHDMQKYKAQADDVLRKVAALDDRQKMLAEYFDNNARESLFYPAVFSSNLDTKDAIQLGFLLNMAQFDAGVVAWQEKITYDSVRPITAIQYIYGDDLVDTYDKKDGSPTRISASMWMPYLETDNHPEYPSETACFCAAQAEAMRLYNGGSDAIPDTQEGQLGFQGVFSAGSSVREPGVTPASDEVIRYSTWTEYVDDCGKSRVWSGLNFQSAVDESVKICNGIGRAAYAYFETLLDGSAQLRMAAQKQMPSAFVAASTDPVAPVVPMTPDTGDDNDNDNGDGNNNDGSGRNDNNNGNLDNSDGVGNISEDALAQRICR